MTLFFHTFAQNLETLHQQGRQLSMLAYVTGAEDEMIQLVRPARVKPVVPVLAYPGTNIVSCCYMRAWTGYDVERKFSGEEQEEYVYITENGTVYHRERNCTHLTLSIELAGKDEVGQLRNESGGKYYPSEKCGGDGSSFVYVTGEGTRYHNTITCSGLKRTVISIPRVVDVFGAKEVSVTLENRPSATVFSIAFCAQWPLASANTAFRFT